MFRAGGGGFLKRGVPCGTARIGILSTASSKPPCLIKSALTGTVRDSCRRCIFSSDE